MSMPLRCWSAKRLRFHNSGPAAHHRASSDSDWSALSTAPAPPGCRRRGTHHGLGQCRIGIAYAAYYPTLTLSARGGTESSLAKHLLDWPSRFWSIGPSVSETIYDGGLRRATVHQ